MTGWLMNKNIDDKTNEWMHASMNEWLMNEGIGELINVWVK